MEKNNNNKVDIFEVNEDEQSFRKPIYHILPITMDTEI